MQSVTVLEFIFAKLLHLLCKYLLGGRVTLGERAFGQILTVSDHPSYNAYQSTVSAFIQQHLHQYHPNMWFERAVNETP